MKVAQCEEFGPPANLKIADKESPGPGKGEVKIAVGACGVNFADLLVIQGQYQVESPLPVTPGGEIAGEIIELGSNVENVKVGDRVATIMFSGGYAEHVVVPAVAVFPLPDSLDFITAAGMIVTYGTAYHAFKQRAELKKGETVLVLGAAGGAGSAAVQIAHLMGAKTIAAASSDEKLDVAKELGADEGINYNKSDLKESLRGLTGGRGVDVVFDPVGGDLFESATRCLNWNARYLVIGFASGKIPELAINRVLLRSWSLTGVYWGMSLQNEPDIHVKNFRQLFTWYENNKIKPHIGGVYSLEEASTALERLAQRKSLGKLVLKISE